MTPRPHRRSRHAALLAVGTAVALVSGGCGVFDDDNDNDNGRTDPEHGVTGGGAPVRTVDSYVALGDSFAAFGPVSAPTSGPPACLRSTANYPALVAEALGGPESAGGPQAGGGPVSGGGPQAGDGDPGSRSAGDMVFVDATCGGAQTTDLTRGQLAGIPPQFDALTADTDLVTLSIGGNDIGFGAIAECVMTTRAEATAEDSASTGAVDPGPCRDRLAQTVTDALEALPEQLDRVYAGIRERSPDARVVTTGYLPLVPADGGCAFVASMNPGDVTWTRDVTRQINEVVAEAAARAGADLAMPGQAQQHSGCAAPADRYTDFTGSETGSHPMHPTALGQAAMAEAVAAAV